jgi:hypothetical protein
VSKALEYAPRDPDHAVVLADLDPELHRLPLAIPAGVLGGRCPQGMQQTNDLGCARSTLGHVPPFPWEYTLK